MKERVRVWECNACHMMARTFDSDGGGGYPLACGGTSCIGAKWILTHEEQPDGSHPPPPVRTTQEIVSEAFSSGPYFGVDRTPRQELKGLRVTPDLIARATKELEDDMRRIQNGPKPCVHGNTYHCSQCDVAERQREPQFPEAIPLVPAASFDAMRARAEKAEAELARMREPIDIDKVARVAGYVRKNESGGFSCTHKLNEYVHRDELKKVRDTADYHRAKVSEFMGANVKLSDTLGDKDHEIGQLRAKVGELTMQLRAAGRR